MQRAVVLAEVVVMAVLVAILAGVLFPVFGRWRQNAREISCLLNERRICLALLKYVDDYDGHFPPCWTSPKKPGDRGTTCLGWQHLLFPYVEENSMTFYCPAGPCPNLSEYGPSPQALGYPWTYRYPMYALILDTIVPGKALSHIRKPTATAMLVEVYRDNITRVPSKGGAANYRAVHNGGLNVGWCDGHVGWMKYSTLTTGRKGNVDWYFDPRDK